MSPITMRIGERIMDTVIHTSKLNPTQPNNPNGEKSAPVPAIYRPHKTNEAIKVIFRIIEATIIVLVEVYHIPHRCQAFWIIFFFLEQIWLSDSMPLSAS